MAQDGDLELNNGVHLTRDAHAIVSDLPPQLKPGKAEGTIWLQDRNAAASTDKQKVIVQNEKPSEAEGLIWLDPEQGEETSRFWDYAFSVFNALIGKRLRNLPPGKPVEETITARARMRSTAMHKACCECGCSLVLHTRGPMDCVISVTREDSCCPVDWTQTSAHAIRINKGDLCNACGGCETFVVTYYPKAIPEPAKTAIEKLANEFEQAAKGGPCALPTRVTSVSRQGVSWTLLDPQDFFDKGLTGIYEVDAAIRALNPTKALRRARVFTVENPPCSTRPIRPGRDPWRTNGV